MFCPRCNSMLPIDSEFCQFCGMKIKNGNDMNVVETSTPQGTTRLSDHETINMPIADSSINKNEDVFALRQYSNDDIEKIRPSNTYKSHLKNKLKQHKRFDMQDLKRKPLILMVVLLAFFLAVSAGFNIYQSFLNQKNIKNMNELSANISSLESTVESLEETVSSQKKTITNQQKSKEALCDEIQDLREDLREERLILSFYERHACIVYADGSRRYHVYGCEYHDGDSCWIYNTEAAEGKGYYPCPYCH